MLRFLRVLLPPISCPFSSSHTHIIKILLPALAGILTIALLGSVAFSLARPNRLHLALSTVDSRLLFDHLCDELIKIALHYEILSHTYSLLAWPGLARPDLAWPLGQVVNMGRGIAAGSSMRAQHELHTSSSNYRTGARSNARRCGSFYVICS